MIALYGPIVIAIFAFQGEAEAPNVSHLRRMQDQMRANFGRELQIAPVESFAELPDVLSAKDIAPECGANCLFMYLRMNGIDVTEVGVRKTVPVIDKGANMLDLKRASEQFGLPSEVVQLNPSELVDGLCPLIARLHTTQGDDHFVVVLQVNDKGVKLIDGTTGNIVHFRQAAFSREYAGQVLSRVSSRRWLTFGRLLWILFVAEVAGVLFLLTEKLWQSQARRRTATRI